MTKPGFVEKREKLEKEHNKEVEKEIKSLIEDNPTKLLSYFTLISGKECIKANVNELVLSLDADHESSRYTITQVMTVKKHE